MKQVEVNPLLDLEQYLKVYNREPLGNLLSDRLQLPLSFIFGIFVFIYFGVLLALHTVLNTPRPANIGEVLQFPSTIFYYPNILGIAYDIIGNPIQFVLLVFFRKYIPLQLTTLFQDDIINPKPRAPKKFDLFHWLCQAPNAHTLTVVVIPLLNAVLGIFVDMQKFGLTGGIPGMYGVLLSFFGRYVRLSIIVQIVYVFLILGLHSINRKLNIRHPDGCNGYAPFGNLSTIIYLFLFIFALTQSVVTTISISSGNTLDNVILIYLWIVFPIATLFVFERLIYQPHKILSATQKQYLLDSSHKWNNYYFGITSNLEKHIGDDIKNSSNLSVVLQNLDDWKKLDTHVSNIHTWPISKHSIRVLSTLSNPFIPVLLPIVPELLKKLSS